jgi:hypothetical protein
MLYGTVYVHTEMEVEAADDLKTYWRFRVFWDITYVDWWTVTGVLETCTASIFRVFQSTMTVVRLKLLDPEDGGSTLDIYQSTSCNIPEHLDVQEPCCEDLKSRNFHYLQQWMM